MARLSVATHDTEIGGPLVYLASGGHATTHAAYASDPGVILGCYPRLVLEHGLIEMEMVGPVTAETYHARVLGAEAMSRQILDADRAGLREALELERSAHAHATNTLRVLREEVATLRAMLEYCIDHGVGPGEPCRCPGRACAARRARVKGPGL